MTSGFEQWINNPQRHARVQKKEKYPAHSCGPESIHSRMEESNNPLQPKPATSASIVLIKILLGCDFSDLTCLRFVNRSLRRTIDSMHLIPQVVESSGVDSVYRFHYWLHCSERRCPNQVQIQAYDVPEGDTLERTKEGQDLQHVIEADIERLEIMSRSLSNNQENVDENNQENNNPNGPQLRRLIVAFCTVRPTVGYCQGMISLLSSLLVALDFNESLVFQSFCILVDCYGFEDLYRPGMEGALLRFYQFQRCVQCHFPPLARHWAQHEIDVSMFCSSWFITMFGGDASVPDRTRSHVLDLLFQNGWCAIMRLSLLLLESNITELHSASLEKTWKILSTSLSRASFMRDHANLSTSAHYQYYRIVVTERELDAYEAEYVTQRRGFDDPLLKDRLTSEASSVPETTPPVVTKRSNITTLMKEFFRWK